MTNGLRYSGSVMRPYSKRRFAEDDQTESNRVTSSLAGLALMLLLVNGGLVLVRHLHQTARVEDCLLAGRINCDAVLAP